MVPDVRRSRISTPACFRSILSMVVESPDAYSDYGVDGAGNDYGTTKVSKAISRAGSTHRIYAHIFNLDACDLFQEWSLGLSSDGRFNGAIKNRIFLSAVGIQYNSLLCWRGIGQFPLG